VKNFGFRISDFEFADGKRVKWTARGLYQYWEK